MLWLLGIEGSMHQPECGVLMGRELPRHLGYLGSRSSTQAPPSIPYTTMFNSTRKNIVTFSGSNHARGLPQGPVLSLHTGLPAGHVGGVRPDQGLRRECGALPGELEGTAGCDGPGRHPGLGLALPS